MIFDIINTAALVFTGVVLIFITGFFVGISYGKLITMKDVYQRGAAIQCLGETGYFWECDP